MGGRDVGLVAIGRNEGSRLRACLEAAVRQADRLIYVDSGSTDDSVAIAEALGVQVVHLDPAEGFTAAKARNMGAAALADSGAPAFLQFVDGDCELVPGWIATARAALEADPGLAVVAGRRRERFPDASIYNRLCDMEWNTPLGEAAAVGGDALYRTAAFQEVGGFDPAFICGEEPELCFRLRRAGWRVARLDAEMTLHDAAMTRWSQWRKRTERTGWAFAEGAATYGDSPERYNVGARRSVLFWGGLVPAGILACLLAALALNAVDRQLAAAALAFGLLGLAAYPLNALRVARARARAFGDPMPHAVLYGVLVLLGKPFEFLGLLRYHRARARGERGRIIEYKGPDAGGAA